MDIPKQLSPRFFWSGLRELTPARIGLERTGSSMATKELLAFQLAHAEAQDAVHDEIDTASLLEAIHQRGLGALSLQTQASDRNIYLARPDLGRVLNDESRARLAQTPRNYDLVVAIADGLSARAITNHAMPLLDEFLKLTGTWKIGPVAVVEQGRVAIGDEIGEALNSKLVAVFIGERPGLGSPDSLGVYLTWAPRIGCNDAERNCLSNICPAGMPIHEAAARLYYLCDEARKRLLTGINLKDEYSISMSNHKFIS